MMYSRHLLDVMNLILHSKEFSSHHSPFTKARGVDGGDGQNSWIYPISPTPLL